MNVVEAEIDDFGTAEIDDHVGQRWICGSCLIEEIEGILQHDSTGRFGNESCAIAPRGAESHRRFDAFTRIMIRFAIMSGTRTSPQGCAR